MTAGVRFPCDDAHGLLTLTIVVERDAGHRGLQHLPDTLRRDAECPRTVLIDHQLHCRHRLQPVVMDGAKQRVLGEAFLHLVGDVANLLPVRTH